MELSVLQHLLAHAMSEHGEVHQLELLAHGSYLPNLDHLQRVIKSQKLEQDKANEI